MDLQRIVERTKEYAGAAVFNPMVWGFSIALTTMAAQEPMMRENLLPSAGAVAIVSIGGMLRYRELKAELSDNMHWSTDLFRRHRSWVIYAWADAHEQRPQYHRWKKLYETEVHWGARSDEF